MTFRLWRCFYVSQQKEQFSQRFFAVLEIMFSMMCCKGNELKRGQRMLLLLCWLCCLPPFLAAAASGQTDLLFIPTKNVTDSHWTSKRLLFDGDKYLKQTICCFIVSSFFLSKFGSPDEYNNYRRSSGGTFQLKKT